MSGILQRAGIVFTALFVITLARADTPADGTATAPKDAPVGAGIIVVTSHAIREAAIFHQEPEYPAAARQFRLGGEVTIELTVGLDGKVENVEVTKGRPILNEAVVRAVRKWSFSPFMIDGHPRKVKGTLSFNFQM
jgi:TonB family protein